MEMMKKNIYRLFKCYNLYCLRNGCHVCILYGHVEHLVKSYFTEEHNQHISHRSSSDYFVFTVGHVSDIGTKYFLFYFILNGLIESIA